MDLNQWKRLEVAIRSIKAVISSEPRKLAALKPLADRALELLAVGPSNSHIEEIAYLLQRVDAFISRWRPQPSPGVFYSPPFWAVSIDRETQEARRLVNDLIEVSGSMGNSSNSSHKEAGGMRMFVSHSSADRALAAAFVELVRAALPLSAQDIRCTSVDGYKLPAGIHSDEQLRKEVFDAQVFVVLLSPVSVKSVYVLFEMGARWGAKGYLAPVMVSGLDATFLKAPLSSLHAVHGTSEADLYQLVDTFAATLGIQAEKPPVYLKALHSFTELAKMPATVV